eukprot:18831_4
MPSEHSMFNCSFGVLPRTRQFRRFVYARGCMFQTHVKAHVGGWGGREPAVMRSSWTPNRHSLIQQKYSQQLFPIDATPRQHRVICNTISKPLVPERILLAGSALLFLMTICAQLSTAHKSLHSSTLTKNFDKFRQI